MRPVLLEMAGFASFRDPTTVDFREAEYFALVGPTGSGKSTVIDALTFALYGSVPRWDNPRTVALALAPTVGRGTVRLVFDVGGRRYVVARELRRAASGSVSVRTARLERLRDPAGTGAPEEETEPLADGAAATTRAVEELLGLPFADFTTCVVLPQGEFAEFLHTEPRKRQETLVRLLGLGIYDVIAREANAEAKAQEQRAQLLTEQVGGYADATADAEREAAARVAALAALLERTAADGAELTAAAAALAAATAGVGRLDAERGLLAGLVAPADTAALARRHREGAQALAAAVARDAAAGAAEAVAREALDAGPAREPLERARQNHRERAAVADALPAARERLERARADTEAAAKEAEAALVAVDTARAARDAAAAALDHALESGRRLAAERDALGAPVPPDGLGALGARRATAAAALATATAALTTAESADEAARAALAAAPQRAPLDKARQDLRELVAERAALAAAGSALSVADHTAAGAAAALAAATEHLDHARARRAASARADLAAELRPGLAVGADCPVCARTVEELPAPRPAGDLAVAERALVDAAAAHEAARRADLDAATAAARAAAGAENARAAVARREAALAALVLPAAEPRAAGPAVAEPRAAGPFAAERGAAGPAPDADPSAALPTVERVDAALAHLDATAEAARATDAGLRRGRADRDRAAAEVEAVRTAAAAAAAALRRARDPLVPLGAPPVTDDGDTDPAAGWSVLLDWAGAAAAERAAALPGARAAHEQARESYTGAGAAVARAEETGEARRRAETAAVRVEQDAAGQVDRLEARAGELDVALDGAPPPDVAAAELDRLATLEDRVRAAAADLRDARAARRAAEVAAAAAADEIATAWERLRSARDPLVPLGAPAAVGDDLAAAWSTLTGWAAATAAAHDDRLATARAERAAAQERRDAVAGRVLADLDAHGVDHPGRPDRAEAAVAAALERARGARERVAERRAAAASLLADRAAAVETQQVARLLGQLLRSDGFPRWLVASALDTLVAEASASLAELSGGQFELTHADGEFLVVDHADADARRPVKTLSGGETFQASLALALALSTHLSGLAVHGAARLESIFLDEGFGTLDEANLETVAGTLETLAARGDRVVGVITHVPALAERVPVRFAVRRDQRGSSVVREDL